MHAGPASRTPPGALAAALILAAVTLFAPSACNGKPRAPAQQAPAPPAPIEAPPRLATRAELRAAADAALAGHAKTLGRVGALAALAAVGIFIGAAFPVIGAFVPARAAGLCAAAAGACWLAEYWLIAYGHLAAGIALALTLAAVGFALIPYALTAWRWIIHRQGAALIAAGNIRDGVALAAAGNRRVNQYRRLLADNLTGSTTLQKQFRLFTPPRRPEK